MDVRDFQMEISFIDGIHNKEASFGFGRASMAI